MSELDTALSLAFDMLEYRDGVSITFALVPEGTTYSLTALLEDLPDTGSGIRRAYAIPTSTLSRDPDRQDTVTDSDGNVWTVLETARDRAGRVRCEVAILQSRGR